MGSYYDFFFPENILVQTIFLKYNLILPYAWSYPILFFSNLKLFEVRIPIRGHTSLLPEVAQKLTRRYYFCRKNMRAQHNYGYDKPNFNFHWDTCTYIRLSNTWILEKISSSSQSQHKKTGV